jgi:hypothetical protein
MILDLIQRVPVAYYDDGAAKVMYKKHLSDEQGFEM